MHAYAGCAAEKKTNPATRATPATAATATMAVRWRSRNDGWWMTRGRSRRPARADAPDVPGRVVRAGEEGRVDAVAPALAAVDAAVDAVAPAPAAAAAAGVPLPPAPAAFAGEPVPDAPVPGPGAGALAVGLDVDPPVGRAGAGCRAAAGGGSVWSRGCLDAWVSGMCGAAARDDRALPRRPQPAQREGTVPRPSRPCAGLDGGAGGHHEAVADATGRVVRAVVTARSGRCAPRPGAGRGTSPG